MMLHKYSQDFTLNMVNYMTNYTEDSKFMGFISVDSPYGMIFDELDEDTTAMAVHYEGVQSEVKSEEGARELELIAQGNDHLVCILGSDNGSYMKRFPSKEAFLEWFKAVQIYRPITDVDVLFYNS